MYCPILSYIGIALDAACPIAYNTCIRSCICVCIGRAESFNFYVADHRLIYLEFRLHPCRYLGDTHERRFYVFASWYSYSKKVLPHKIMHLGCMLLHIRRTTRFTKIYITGSDTFRAIIYSICTAPKVVRLRSWLCTSLLCGLR